MTPSLSKDIQCHAWSYCFVLVLWENIRADIMPHVKWALNLVIWEGHFNIPQGFVVMGGLWYGLTYLITLEGLERIGLI